jgi:hypothetical protein
MELKRTTPAEILCSGFPDEFATFLNYTRALQFEDTPDYSYLRKLLNDLCVQQGYQYDCVFDWNMVQRDGCGVGSDGVIMETAVRNSGTIQKGPCISDRKYD